MCYKLGKTFRSYSDLTLTFYPIVVNYYFKNMCQNETLTTVSMVIQCTNWRCMDKGNKNIITSGSKTPLTLIIWPSAYWRENNNWSSMILLLWLWDFLYYGVGQQPVSSLHIYTFVVLQVFMAGAARQAGDTDSSRAPGLTSGLQGSLNVHRGALLLVPQWQCIRFFFCILHFCHTCSLCRVELVVQFPARGSTQVLLCFFPGVLWLWHFLYYGVGPQPVSSLHIYTLVVSRAFMAGAAGQAGDADSFRAPGLTSGLQGSLNVHRGALLLVPQWQCISSFVFYILVLYSVLSWHCTLIHRVVGTIYDGPFPTSSYVTGPLSMCPLIVLWDLCSLFTSRLAEHILHHFIRYMLNMLAGFLWSLCVGLLMANCQNKEYLLQFINLSLNKVCKYEG